MKMVSAAKFARAEKDLKSARPLGTAAQAFYEQAEVSHVKCHGPCLIVSLSPEK